MIFSALDNTFQYISELSLVRMPPKNFVRDTERIQIQLISTLMKMAKMGIPVAAFWYNQNKTQIYGSKNLKNLLTQMDEATINDAIKLDVFNLSSSDVDEPLLHNIEDDTPDVMNTRAQSSFQNISQKENPDFLPFPLSCMNRVEKTQWITKEILRDQQNKTGKLFKKVKYGDESLRPSFWLQDEWDWKEVTKNLSNIKDRNYSGKGYLGTFITNLITNCLSAINKDPETFVNPNIDNNKLKKRKKSHRIHEESHILENEAIPDDNTESSIDFGSEEAEPSTYRSPMNCPPPSTSSNFIPRRQLPDNMPYRCPTTNENLTIQDSDVVNVDLSNIGPLPPMATPVSDGLPIRDQQSYTYVTSELFYLSQLKEPNLSNDDFRTDIKEGRTCGNPPYFLNELSEPLDPGWKAMENTGGGPCLFKSCADSIGLKDFRHLRRYTHAHMIDQWYFFQSFYTFPIQVTIGAGNITTYKIFETSEDYLAFLKTEESMLAWNHSNAEIVAIGQVLNANVIVLTYNIQNRRGSREERTQWNQFDLHPGFALPQNIFSRRSPNTLRLLNEDNVHFRFLIWLPDGQNQRMIPTPPRHPSSPPPPPPPRRMPTPPSQQSPPPPPTPPRMMPTPPRHQSPPQPPPRSSSMTRKRSREEEYFSVTVKINNIAMSDIVDMKKSKNKTR